jgi:hypothetical protein
MGRILTIIFSCCVLATGYHLYQGFRHLDLHAPQNTSSPVADAAKEAQEQAGSAKLAACNKDASYFVSSTTQREFADVQDIPGGIAYHFRADSWDVVRKKIKDIMPVLANADACEFQMGRTLKFYRPDGSKVGSVDPIHGAIGFALQ